MKGAWRVARWVLLVAALVAVVGGLLTLAIWVLPGVLVGPARTGLAETDRLKALNDARSSLVTVVGGLLLFTGALIGAYLTSRTIHINRQGQITDRFTRAIDQLGQHGEDKLDVRLGGIYALERIARESAEDHGPIMEVLTAYLREHARVQPGRTVGPVQPEDQEDQADSADVDGASRLRADFQAVAAVLGRRPEERRRQEQRPLDLREVDLRNADLSGAQLKGANLSDAQLERADLRGAQLERADLSGAQLERADLSGAQLEGADLRGAQLERADLSGAQLKGADLRGAQLKGAFLRDAQLKGANLSRAQLKGANLRDAQLEGANLSRAQLKGAFLIDAQLEGADLSDAQLEGANLSDAQLKGAPDSRARDQPQGSSVIPTFGTGDPGLRWSHPPSSGCPVSAGGSGKLSVRTAARSPASSPVPETGCGAILPSGTQRWAGGTVPEGYL